MPIHPHRSRRLAARLAFYLGLFVLAPGFAQGVGPTPSVVAPRPATDGLSRTLPMPIGMDHSWAEPLYG